MWDAYDFYLHQKRDFTFASVQKSQTCSFGAVYNEYWGSKSCYQWQLMIYSMGNQQYWAYIPAFIKNINILVMLAISVLMLWVYIKSGASNLFLYLLYVSVSADI